MKPWPQSLILLLAFSTATLSWAEAQEHTLTKIATDHSPATLRGGAKMVLGLCMSCHDLKYLRYRDLLSIGLRQDSIDAFRGERAMEDRLLSLTPASQREALFGLVPPDLSLIAKARAGGASYVYTLLTSFHETTAGTVDNRLFPGIRMPDALGSSSASNRDAVNKTARQVAMFLDWAADPQADKRHALGYYVVSYLALLTLLLYFNKKRVWQRLDDSPSQGAAAHSKADERQRSASEACEQRTDLV